MKTIDIEELFFAHLIAWDDESNISITINPGANLDSNPYFSCFNNSSFSDADRVVRFDIYTPRIRSDFNWIKKKQEWDVSEQDIKSIVKLLDSPWNIYPDISIWQFMLFKWNYEFGFFNEESPKTHCQNNMFRAYVKGYMDLKNETEDQFIPGTTLRPLYEYALKG